MPAAQAPPYNRPMNRPRKQFRKLDGILLLDKPRGLSSNQALQRARHLFAAEKAGHTGSLDPLATGLLPVCFGEATKIAGYLLGNSKAYETTAKLGVVTDTDDADGAVLRERPVPELSRERVEAALRPFLGKIPQRPPIYSALKQGGEPLYAKARRGEAIEVPERDVEVHAIELLAIDGDAAWTTFGDGMSSFSASLKARLSFLGVRPVDPFVQAGVGYYRTAFSVDARHVPPFYEHRMMADLHPAGVPRAFNDPSLVAGAGVSIFVSRHFAIRPAVDATIVLHDRHGYVVTTVGLHGVFHFEDHPVTPLRRR